MVRKTYAVRLFGLFDVMCRDDDGQFARSRGFHQETPNLLSQKRIETDRRLVQNQKFRLVNHRGCERNSPLLTAGTLSNLFASDWEVEQLTQQLVPLADPLRRHPVNPSEVINRFFDGELLNQRDLLRHITDSRAGNTRAFGARRSTQNIDFTLIQKLHAYDAREQSGFSAT